MINHWEESETIFFWNSNFCSISSEINSILIHFQTLKNSYETKRRYTTDETWQNSLIHPVLFTIPITTFKHAMPSLSNFQFDVTQREVKDYHLFPRKKHLTILKTVSKLWSERKTSWICVTVTILSLRTWKITQIMVNLTFCYRNLWDSQAEPFMQLKSFPYFCRFYVNQFYFSFTSRQKYPICDSF